MKQDYTDIIEDLSQLLSTAIQEREINLSDSISQLDGEVAELLREVGWQVMSMLLNAQAEQVTEEAKKAGSVIHRRLRAKYSVIFGAVEVDSPYLWNKQEHRGSRPVLEKLGIKHRALSTKVTRALTDFGSEESFAQATKRFEEHYGWSVKRSKMRREVENIARQAFTYVEERLLMLSKTFANLQPPKKRNGWNRILGELDGCQIRTGILSTSATEELTPTRQIKKRSRDSDWREVRVGFARPVESKQQRTFVALMEQYPEVVQQLHGAAVDQGLSTYTLVYGLADGGNGLKEALEVKFDHFQFILDQPHLKHHLHDTADALELTGKERSIWLNCLLSLINHGQVKKVLSHLKKWSGTEENTVVNLSKYLERFRNSIHYDKYRSLGLPIGSGEIESAHRYIPQKRLKIPGATWHPDNINPMLALRIIRANDWWHDFWTAIAT